MLDDIRFPARLGGQLCLDFTNTAEFRHTEQPQEFLRSYTHVLAWVLRGGDLSPNQVTRLYERALAQPSAAESAFHAIIAFRERLYTCFNLWIEQQTPIPEVVTLVNEKLARLLPRRQVSLQGENLVWAWDETPDDFEAVLAPVVLAAADLLTSPQLQRVRCCPGCGWLFVDTSRNHSRRWCSMEVCGSQAKSRRQYERKKQSLEK